MPPGPDGSRRTAVKVARLSGPVKSQGRNREAGTCRDASASLPCAASGTTEQVENTTDPMRVGFYTECYRPIVNGVVASIDALRAGLCAHGVEIFTIAPHFPRFIDDDASDVVRVPSLPLPTQTAYRLCVPYLNAGDRRRVRGIDLVHAHSPFVTGWMGASCTRRSRWCRARSRSNASPPAAPLALVVSRLGLEKNVELAIDALARIAELRLAIVGEGPHRPVLEERAQRLGVAGRVRFVGNVARERLPDVYASADAFIFPSTTDTQALAAGLPVVAAESDASRDVLAGAGRVVPPDADAIAAALADALATGHDHSAVHLALSRFTVEVQTRRILEIYREVLAARAA